MTTIVGTLPATIRNGDSEDATVVMSLFAYIQSQVNSNACPATSGSAILKGNGSGGTVAAAAGTDFLAPVTGAVFDYAGSGVPAGYLACDGSAVSRTTYATLFAAIGVIWGAGDGSTTFNVPDLRRRATIGAGGTQVSGPSNSVGSVGGEETHVLTATEIAVHSHVINISDPGHVHGVTDPTHVHSLAGGKTVRFLDVTDTGGANYAAASAASTIDAVNTGAAATGISINLNGTGITASSNNAGGGGAHNNMQPSAVVQKIIKT